MIDFALAKVGEVLWDGQTWPPGPLFSFRSHLAELQASHLIKAFNNESLKLTRHPPPGCGSGSFHPKRAKLFNYFLV